MSTKKQLRSENIKEKKVKKSTKAIYLLLIMGGGFIVLAIFFVILFSALFPTEDMEAMKKKEKIAAKIYFSDPQERFLKTEKHWVIKENDRALQIKEIIKVQLEGAKSGLINTFPESVTAKDIRGVTITDEGVAMVSFGKNLMKCFEGSSAAEMATIFSLTHSITHNIPEIKKVKILIEDKEVPSLKGHISTTKAFAPDPELIIPEN
jgi:hypothetical protein